MVCDNKYAHYFLDPLFWKSLGKGLGWEDGEALVHEKYVKYQEWKINWHRFIDALADGRSAEDFFSGIMDKNICTESSNSGRGIRIKNLGCEITIVLSSTAVFIDMNKEVSLKTKISNSCNS